ncbi:mitochondrial carrier domain-containing protein [Hypoxylon sp. FL1150]|nr:mitochondrial carrier domain-containing protein [Hypoxylon sp. FL1150]
MPSSSSRLPISTGSISADKFLPALQHAVSGSAGTLISTCTLYPLSLVVTRLQVQRQLRRERLRNRPSQQGAAGTTTTDPSGRGAAAGTESDPTADDRSGIVAAFSQIWNSGGGLRAFYTGLGTDAAKSVLDSFLFFLFYEWFRGLRLAARRRRHRGYDRTKGLAVLEELAVGMAAGACSRLFTTPIANVVTRKQTASLVNGANGELSVNEILGDIRREKGLAGFWSGYSASLVLTLNPSITFFLQEFLKKQTVAPDSWDSPAAHVTFLLAAVSKAVASTITYPFQTAKTRLQAGVPVAPPESPKQRAAPSPKSEAPKDEALIDLASAEAQASEGAEASKAAAEAPKEGEASAEAASSKKAPEEAAVAKEPEAPQPPVPRENVAPPERTVEREVDAKLEAVKAVKDFGKQSIFGTVAQIARTEGVGSLYDGLLGELLKAFLSHGTTMLAKDVVHKLLFKLYLFVGTVLAEVRARRAKRAAARGAVPAPVVRESAPVRETTVTVSEEVHVPVPPAQQLPEPEPEPELEPTVMALTEKNLESFEEAQAQGPSPSLRGDPIPPRLVPEPPAPSAYPTAVTPTPRAPAYLPPPPPPPPPPVPHQQLRSLRYRIGDVDGSDNRYPPPYPPSLYPPSSYPSYVYRPPLPPAPATDVSVRTRMSRNDIERATPSVLEDFAVNVVANMIDGTQRGLKDD